MTTARTAEEIIADGARPHAAAQQAQLEAWAAGHGLKRMSPELVKGAILADYLEACAADGFMSATRHAGPVPFASDQERGTRFPQVAADDPGPVPTPAPVTMPDEYRYLSPDTARTLHAVDTMRLTDDERRRMIEYMTGYDTDAVNAGLTFIAYTRRPRHPGPQS